MYARRRAAANVLLWCFCCAVDGLEDSTSDRILNCVRRDPGALPRPTPVALVTYITIRAVFAFDPVHVMVSQGAHEMQMVMADTTVWTILRFVHTYTPCIRYNRRYTHGVDNSTHGHHPYRPCSIGTYMRGSCTCYQYHIRPSVVSPLHDPLQSRTVYLSAQRDVHYP